MPQLIDRGHTVIGTYRSPDHAEALSALGVEPVVLDLLDAQAVREEIAPRPERPRVRGAVPREWHPS